MAKTVRNLWSSVVSWDNLLLAYDRCRRRKRYKRRATEFEHLALDQLLHLQADLASETWRPGEYHHFHVTDPKPRLISQMQTISRSFLPERTSRLAATRECMALRRDAAKQDFRFPWWFAFGESPARQAGPSETVLPGRQGADLCFLKFDFCAPAGALPQHPETQIAESQQRPNRKDD